MYCLRFVSGDDVTVGNDAGSDFVSYNNGTLAGCNKRGGGSVG